MYEILIIRAIHSTEQVLRNTRPNYLAVSVVVEYLNIAISNKCD